jgi:threonine dehydratase
VLRTPFLPSPRLSELTGATVFIKYENMHPIGAFKERGAANKLAHLADDERRRGVIAMSAGNHAQAVAYHARRCGIPATIVMPETTPLVKAESTRAYGAAVVLHGEGLSDAADQAHAIAAEKGFVFVHPYDDPLVMAGQGTVGLEIAEDMPEVRFVVVPVGGGGLIAGVATAIRGRLGEGVRVIGVEPLDGNDTVLSRAAGQRVEVPLPRTICDGARVQTPGALTFPVLQRRVDEVVAVDDRKVVAAMRLLALGGIYAEPTGARAVAGAAHLGLGEGTVCVVSGRNMEPREWARLVG